MEGEKDPRCLLVCLRLACSVLESFGPKIEDLVEVGTAEKWDFEEKEGEYVGDDNPLVPPQVREQWRTEYEKEKKQRKEHCQRHLKLHHNHSQT